MLEKIHVIKIYLYKNFNINYLKKEYTTIRLIFSKKDNYKFKIIFNNALRKNSYNILIIINKELVWLSGLIQKIYTLYDRDIYR